MSKKTNDADSAAKIGHNPLVGRCSFCLKTYREVGPLAEGPDHVFICYPCVQLCADIIKSECVRGGLTLKEAHD